MDKREWEYQRGYVEVDLDAIRQNIEHMKRHLPSGTQMIGVIKTDGYGHGSVPIAHTLEGLDFLFGFAVATAEEALELRRAGVKKPILILGYTFPYAYESLIREDVRLTVFRRDTLGQLAEAAKICGKPARIHIKVDTGMGRIGITPDEKGCAFVAEAFAATGVEVEGIFTHFACADVRDKTSARGQLDVFQSFVKQAQKLAGRRIPYHHCANSAGILELPQAHMDIVRAGITLYGLRPSDQVDMEMLPLRPALSLRSHLVYIKELQPGQSVSYGSTFTAQSPIRVATVPLGYGDGYPRSLSGRGYVLIRGRRANILGRVCMDQFMVDVTDIPEAVEGDPVTLIGEDGRETITADELGDLSGRFNYELVCDLNKRLPRIYLENNQIVDRF